MYYRLVFSFFQIVQFNREISSLFASYQVDIMMLFIFQVPDHHVEPVAQDIQEFFLHNDDLTKLDYDRDVSL